MRLEAVLACLPQVGGGLLVKPGVAHPTWEKMTGCLLSLRKTGKGGAMLAAEFSQSSCATTFLSCRLLVGLWARSSQPEQAKVFAVGTAGSCLCCFLPGHTKLHTFWSAGLHLEEGEGAGASGGEESGSDSEDDLPPIQRINNRRVIEYEVSESESEEE